MAIKISTRAQLEILLRDQPQAWSALIAQRVALRSVPFWKTDFQQETYHNLLLTIFRANLFATIIARWNSKRINGVADLARAAANSAGREMDDFEQKSIGNEQYTTRNILFAPFASASAFASAGALDQNFVIIIRGIVGVTGPVGTWASISRDLTILQNHGLEALRATPIWHGETPDWFSRNWIGLKDALLADNPNWQVWIDFLERRFQGKRSLFGLASDSEKEIIDAIVKEGEAFWDRDAHLVNADLVARIEERRKRDAQSAIDNIPPKSPGLSYSPGPSGKYEREATGIATSDDLAEIEGTKEPLLEALDDLKSACTGTNAYTTVVKNAERYAAVLNAELTRLSVDRLFSYGVRLENARSRLDKEIASGDFPEMAVGIGEALDSVLALHGPMVLSTGRGRDLVARARDYQLGVAQANALKLAATPVATAIANSDKMVETEAADEIVLATADIGEGPHPERSTEVGATALRNFLVSAAKVVGITAAGVVGNAAWGTITGATGATSLETLAAFTYDFFLTYRPDLLILAGTGGPDFAWLSSFLNWLERQHRPKPDSD
ncbi:MAG: hypothetical protein R3D32_14960 [Nitratireductor sp.]